MVSSKKLLTGALISLLSVAGLLILFASFLTRKTFSKRISQIIQASKYKELAPYWVAVSQLETGNFTSGLFVNNKNGFGFTYTANDPYNSGYTLGSGNVKWAKYKSVEDSARAIINYMDRLNYPVDFDSIASFVKFMKSKKYFAENEADYLAGVNQYLS